MTGNDADRTDKTPLEKAISGLSMRGIGPAFMGGRIADIAVHPERKSTWYVAVGSGGVWKTTNAGITWTPVFDAQPSFSIGCVTLDPNRPEVVWVGTGEAVSGRHVAWGDGVYKSLDGGTSWNRMGLERSEHIGRILVDPRDGDVAYVAAEGPLWSSGGDRGLYKTTDGGESWEAVLTIDDDTGVTSAEFAPGDPDTIYAATYQRRRTVWSFVGAGPGSGVHKSTDGGARWRRMTEGLPEGDMGKIGLAVTPAAPELVYATIEAGERRPLEGEGATETSGGDRSDGEDKPERGFYRSSTRGESWEKRSDYISGGTGPHYYQEIFASPTDPERVFQVDVFLHRTTDGGRSFHNLEAKPGGGFADKHSDNHVVWIDPGDGQHLLVGCDGGLYETFDEGGAWRHVSNLPISQFYRVAVDESVPFTNVLGGAQDLGTIYGPTRTMHVDGVRNTDWSVPLGADGYQAAFDPTDPDIAYLEFQVGNVARLDRRTMELTDVKPQPSPGDPPERWNWDTPILISPHDPSRVHVASQRVWRSYDRGDSWNPISPDLTGGDNRYELPTGGRVWSVDGPYDHIAMSHYATITALSESPVAEGVIYAGTDDGRIQVTEDGGESWRALPDPPDLPDRFFVNDVEASRHDEAGVFLAADDHKSGDYTPYLYESTDRGRTWRSIRGDLPAGAVVWQVEQDHIEPDLLFAGTERGLFTSLDRGRHWHRLGGEPPEGVPIISFRDLALQRRDDDLVGASFGRGFHVLDDYSPLRGFTEEVLARPAALFPVRDAWRYVPHSPLQADGQPSQGSTAFRAPNPEFGATFTYHLSADGADDLRTARERRHKDEKSLAEAGGDVPFPGFGSLWEEHVESGPTLLLVVRDGEGRSVRALPADRTEGLHRTTWDLRLPTPSPVDLGDPGFRAPWEIDLLGPLAPAGRYTVELIRVRSGGGRGEGRGEGPRVQALAGPEGFQVRSVPAATSTDAGDGDLDDARDGEAAIFSRRTHDLVRRVDGADERMTALADRLRHLRAGIAAAPDSDPGMFGRLADAHRRLEELRRDLNGDPIRDRLVEPDDGAIRWLLLRVAWFHWDTTAAPTETQRLAVERAAAGFEQFTVALDELVVDVDRLTGELDSVGGPYTPR